METLDRVTREGRGRLYPSLTNPSWLVLRRRREIFQKWLGHIEESQLLVLDVGGRIQPYRPLLEKQLHFYVALDLRRTALVNVIASGDQIPIPDDKVDLVLCTQVLEYVSDPAAVVAEIHRVLKPGGHLLLSVPAVFPQDSEQDRWRFLPDGLALLLRSFTRVEIAAEGSSVAGLFRTVCVCLVMLSRPVFVGKILKMTLVPLLNLTAALLEPWLASENTQFAANFSALAKK